VAAGGVPAKFDGSRAKEGKKMNHVMLNDVRAAFFLLMGLLMLAMICAVAALGTVMRPVRWADRRSAQF
jgi:Tfp pilus assembly protein PilN